MVAIVSILGKPNNARLRIFTFSAARFYYPEIYLITALHDLSVQLNVVIFTKEGEKTLQF